MPVWVPGVDIIRTAFLRTSFKMLKKRVVFKQECPVQLICSRDANHIVFVQKTKKSNKLERICKHESSSKSVMVVANIYVSLQFCGKAALKRRTTLSYN